METSIELENKIEELELQIKELSINNKLMKSQFEDKLNQLILGSKSASDFRILSSVLELFKNIYTKESK